MKRRIAAALVLVFALVLSSASRAEPVNFAQITDPHIFDEVAGCAERKGNLEGLRWCIEQINSREAQRPYAFVIVTGDFGLEKLPGGDKKTDEDLQAAAGILAPIIGTSSVKRWLLVPGNNDLVAENPNTLDNFHRFVAALRGLLKDHDIVDFSPRPGDATSGVLSIGKCRFIGFDNASFKSNNLEADATKFETNHLANIADVSARLTGAADDFHHAFVFFHIPNTDDPFWKSVGPDNEDFKKNTKARGALAEKYPYSAWTVTEPVREAWAVVVADPRVKGLFAGHFHWPIRLAYDWDRGAGTTTPEVSKLYIAPPIAGKRQTGKPETARGFRDYTVDCASGRVERSEFAWYEPDAQRLKQAQRSQAEPRRDAGAQTEQRSSSSLLPVVLLTLSLVGLAGLAWWVAFLPLPATPSGRVGLVAAVLACVLCAVLASWHLGQGAPPPADDSSSPLPFLLLMLATAGSVGLVWFFVARQPRGADSTPKDTITVALVFFAAAVLGFAVLASLAWTQGAAGNTSQDAARLVSVGALWALAAIAVGAAVGFLFGIPRNTATATVRPNPGPALEVAEQTPPTAKTNLEEIADWLSKLLVGGTLFSSGRLLQQLDSAGKTFATTITGRPADSEVGGLWGGVGSACLVYFGIVGVFGGYFLTRLYLIGALNRADGGRQVVKERSGLTAAQIAALDAAPLGVDNLEPEFDPIAKEAAEEIIKLPLESLANWRDIRQWAKAQLGKGDVDSAIKAYQKGIEIVPHDAEMRLGYAVALWKKKSARGLILSQLEDAHGSLMLNSSVDLRKNIYKSLTHLWLYGKSPEGFSKAIRYAREFLNGPDAIDSGGLWVNIACAYGQAYAWLSADSTRRVTAEDVTVKGGPVSDVLADANRPRLLDWIREQALAAMRLALARDPAWKPRLRQLMGLDAAPGAEEDKDLVPFERDKEFRALVDEPPVTT